MRLQQWNVAQRVLVVFALAFGLTATSTALANQPTGSPFNEFERQFQNSWTRSDLPSYDALTSGAVSLIDYVRAHISEDRSANPNVPRYNRLEHFGTWMKLGKTKDCRNTRAEVLLRDAEPGAPIEYRDESECSVLKGAWFDLYTNREYRTADAVQIDHVVPLKNAYYAGGFRWEPARRCHYANFIQNNFHLRTVSAHENSAKGARGPEQYIPPNREFTCEYIAWWMRIKAIWELDLTDSEARAIVTLAEQNRCRSSETQISLRELKAQRQAAAQAIEKCADFPSGGKKQKPGSEPDLVF